jgi:aspartyl-tRNA synthetase
MPRFHIQETAKHVGEKVKVSGWADTIRAHGKILFIDLRDRSDFLQLVFVPSNKEVYELAQKVRTEWVLEVEGQIVKRPENMQNKEMETGVVEMAVEKLTVLSESATLPISINTDGREINEELRMKYRYVDLRRQRMKDNLIMRHKVIKFIRDFLDKEGFIEIETPILTKSTPEGSRDFIVPSRLQQGKFFALPQSPQQYKQLLQVAGIEKYFQVAKCMRDEDSRGDRQYEHTQLDMEMSFVEREDVLELVERMFITFIKNLYPQKKIQEIPFPRLSYKDAMEKYNSDKPDLRKDKNDPNLLAFCWIIDFPFFEKSEDGGWTFVHNPFSAPKPEFIDDLLAKKNIGEIIANQYDITLNGYELASGGIRSHRPEMLEAIFEIMGHKKEEIREQFGHMLSAMSFGAPPHGGIAPGIDRILMLLQNEPNIREVIAFPKTGDGRDLMMQAPSEVSEKQLKELGINVVKNNENKVIKKNEKKVLARKKNGL